MARSDLAQRATRARGVGEHWVGLPVRAERGRHVVTQEVATRVGQAFLIDGTEHLRRPRPRLPGVRG